MFKRKARGLFVKKNSLGNSTPTKNTESNEKLFDKELFGQSNAEFDWDQENERSNIKELLDEVDSMSHFDWDEDGEGIPLEEIFSGINGANGESTAQNGLNKAFLFKSMNINDKNLVPIDHVLNNLTASHDASDLNWFKPTELPYSMKLTLESLLETGSLFLNEPHDEKERPKLPDIDDEPYGPTEPILTTTVYEETQEVETYYDATPYIKEQNLPERNMSFDPNYFKLENKHLTQIPIRQGRQRSSSLKIESNMFLASPNKNEKDLTFRVKRASMHLKKSPIGENADYENALKALYRLDLFVNSMADDLNETTIVQMSFIKDLLSIVDVHLVSPTAAKEPQVISPMVAQALTNRMERLSEHVMEDNPDAREQLKKSISTRCNSITNSISIIKNNWQEYNNDQIMKISSAVESVEKFMCELVEQDVKLENKKKEQEVDPRLIKLKDILNDHIKNLLDQFQFIRDELEYYYKQKSALHLALILKIISGINKIIQQEQSFPTFYEDTARLMEYSKKKGKTNDMDLPPQIVEIINKIYKFIKECIISWKNQIDSYNEETKINTTNSGALTQTILSYSNNVNNAEKFLTPFIEQLKKSREATQNKGDYNELTRSVRLCNSLITTLKQKMSRNDTKFTNAEIVYVGKILKDAKEILSKFSYPDFNIDPSSYKMEKIQDQNVNMELIHAFKSACNRTLDTMLEKQQINKNLIADLIKDGRTDPMDTYQKNLKITNTILNNLFVNCLNGKENQKDNALNLINECLNKVKALGEIALNFDVNSDPAFVLYLAQISKNINKVISNINNNEIVKQTIENPPNYNNNQKLKGVTQQKVSLLKGTVVKCFTDISESLRSLKNSLENDNVSENDMQSSIHLLNCVLLVLKTVKEIK